MNEELMAWGEEAARRGRKACCVSAAPPAGETPLPGYRMEGFVECFMETAVGPVPVVRTRLSGADWWGTLRVRCNVGRGHYTVAPGLYAAGAPAEASPVLVTANYKLSFDALRRELGGMDAWILVVDTAGINVWCSAGKKRFTAGEVSRRVEKSGLARLVSHRKLVLPQLAAAGVNGREIKTATGFEVIWGPVRAADLPRFIASGFLAEGSMRRVTFTFWERLVLVPVELSLGLKYLPALFGMLYLLSGIGPGVFSLSSALYRGTAACAALVGGMVAGAVVTPAFLTLLPGRSFAVKGGIAGAVAGVAAVASLSGMLQWAEGLALLLVSSVAGSSLAMNFTGSTPFTSPSGVEKEMRTAIPVQVSGVIVALVIWLVSAFVR